MRQLKPLDVVEIEINTGLFKEKHRYKYLIDPKTGLGLFVNRNHEVVGVTSEYRLLGNLSENRELTLTT